MFKGWLRFGSREVVNHERLKAYVDAGCKPATAVVDPGWVPSGLAAALQEGPYRMPATDDAPWFDRSQPETSWFGGVMVLDVTGLEGSTFSAAVAERLGPGGTVVSARESSRTIGVSAVLIGRDDESVHAGYEWLTNTLKRTCDAADACGGTTLEAFTADPSPVMSTEDLDADPIATVADPDADWPAYGGRWESGTFLTNESAEPGLPDGEAFGGYPATDHWEDEWFGGGPTTDEWEDEPDFGTPTPQTRVGHVAYPGLLGCLSYAKATWTVTPLDDTVRVAVGAVDADGGLLERDPFLYTADLGDSFVMTFTAEQRPWDEWRPALWVSEPGAEVELTVEWRPDVDPDECLRPYQRIFQQVRLVAGPSTVAEHEIDDCAHLMQVEWTWVAGDAFRYRIPEQLVSGVRTNGSGTDPVIADGVTVDYIGTVDAADTACLFPDEAANCALDPLAPGFDEPPKAPRIVDPGIVEPDSYVRTVFRLSPNVVPTAGVGALRMTLENTAAEKRGIRVRMWTAEDPDFASVPECGFVNEWTVRYMESSSVLTVDTGAGAVTVDCIDGSTVNASGVVRGPYGGAFVFPTLVCDQRYFVAVDVPAGQGSVFVDMSVALREG